MTDTNRSNKADHAAQLISEIDDLRNRYLKALCDISANFKHHDTDLIGSDRGLLTAIEKAYETPRSATIVDPNRALIRIAKLVNYAATPETISAGWLGGLEGSIDTMCQENERVGKEHGMLADICDLVFDDEERAAEHGYEGVVDKTREIVTENAAVHRNSEDISYLRKKIEASIHLIFPKEKRHNYTLVDVADALSYIAGEKQSLEMMNEAQAKGFEGIVEALDQKGLRCWEQAADTIRDIKQTKDSLLQERERVCKALHGCDLAHLRQPRGHIDLAADLELRLSQHRERVEEYQKEPDNFRDALAEIRRLVYYDTDVGGVPADADSIVKRTREIIVRLTNLEQRSLEKDDELNNLITFRNAYCDIPVRIPFIIKKLLTEIGFSAGFSTQKKLINLMHEMLTSDSGIPLEERISTKMNRKCECCDALFTIYKSDQNSPKSRYCESCRPTIDVSPNTMVKCVCSNCGNLYSCRHSDINKPGMSVCGFCKTETDPDHSNEPVPVLRYRICRRCHQNFRTSNDYELYCSVCRPDEPVVNEKLRGLRPVLQKIVRLLSRTGPADGQPVPNEDQLNRDDLDAINRL